jgi:hypothetical protein
MRFYLRDLLWDAATEVLKANGGITNYTDLVTRCFQWAAKANSHVCFVSFNYDHLLESACRAHFGLKVDSLPSYLGNPIASVLKPHGSVLWNWVHPDLSDRVFPYQMTTGKSAEPAITSGEPDTIESWDVYASDEPRNQVGVGNTQRMALPAVALPMTQKSHFVWPPEQDKFIRETIPNGSFGRVAIIGWRAAEIHFTELLNRLIPNDSRCLIVTGGTDEIAMMDAAETSANLGEIRHRVEERVVPEGFHMVGNESWNWLLT